MAISVVVAASCFGCSSESPRPSNALAVLDNPGQSYCAAHVLTTATYTISEVKNASSERVEITDVKSLDPRQAVVSKWSSIPLPVKDNMILWSGAGMRVPGDNRFIPAKATAFVSIGLTWPRDRREKVFIDGVSIAYTEGRSRGEVKTALKLGAAPSDKIC